MHIFHIIVVCSILLSKKGHNLVAFQYLKDAYMKDRERLFTMACSDKDKWHWFYIGRESPERVGQGGI